MDSAEVSPVWWDQFLQRRMTEGGEWKDEDDDRLVMYINSQMELHNITADNVRRAAAVYAVSHPRDCAADWLRSLRWDGLTRCARLLVDGFGARDSEYTQAVGRCFVMGMVARVLSPGCQLDNLPVFEGPQGVKKSKALRRLGGEWHAEVHEDIHNKDFYLALAGKMLVEISEFQSFKRGDIEMVKAVISRPTDRYRVPFARSAGDHPRRCAFAATTNNYRWNIDPTGARRFWPVRCGVIEVEWIEASREQLFAEAVALYDRGMPWWDVPEDLAGQEQRARYNLDSIEIPLKRYLAGHTFVTLPNIMEMGLGLEKNQRYDTVLTSRVLSLLTRWGWRESTYTDPDSRQTWDGFSPPEPVAAAPAAHRAKS
jgi:putative DNA primase/helicase